MRNILIFTVIILSISCKSVEDWGENPVLHQDTVNLGKIYVEYQREYLDLLETRNSYNVQENLTIEQLDDYLITEKKIVLASQKVLNSWFDFYLKLRQDPGFKQAFNGHYYFRKGIEILNYSEKMKKLKADSRAKDAKLIAEIDDKESLSRQAVGEIVAYNFTYTDTEILYSELKKLYNSIK